MKDNHTAYDDLSQVTQTVDFSYEEIDRRFGVAHLHEEQLEKLSEADVEKVCEMHRRIWDWVGQDCFKNLDGFNDRSIIAAWVFCSSLKWETKSMTDLAGRFGKKKQSLGRWVDDFKKQFPEVANHMQHVRNHHEQTSEH
jgi:hypothetical protein